ncbi:SAM-dependent methyltransferase [Sphingomonas prati]|nr:SAM-dependent methyltransferase [Sphingomonas prati]
MVKTLAKQAGSVGKPADKQLDKQVVTAAYDRWAPVYDMVFGPVFRRGRRAAIVAAEKVGGRILEVGVGTGISLPDYASTSTLFGVDISEEMLERARTRVTQLKLANVEGIQVMDAEALDFPDAAFDVVVAQYVVTAVPNPERALDEFVRVVRPGGLIVIATRIGAEGGLRGGIERALMPVTSRLGWRTEFAWERYARWAGGAGVELVERRPLPPLGHFALICFRRRDVPVAVAA